MDERFKIVKYHHFLEITLVVFLSGILWKPFLEGFLKPLFPNPIRVV
jgi:hypothetical protein